MSQQQRVIITAGGAGIGRALALAYLAQGARVAVCDVDPKAIEGLSKTHPKILACVADVTDENQMNKFLSQVDEAFGGVDVAIANAGTGGPAA